MLDESERQWWRGDNEGVEETCFLFTRYTQRCLELENWNGLDREELSVSSVRYETTVTVQGTSAPGPQDVGGHE